MAVGAHLVGARGPELLDGIRLRLGVAEMAEGVRPEIFRFGDFGAAPPFHIELGSKSVAAVSGAGELRLPWGAIERIAIKAWPEIGTGMERARLTGGDKMIEFDSRVIGFWPLVDYVIARAPDAVVDDDSRRARLTPSRVP